MMTNTKEEMEKEGHNTNTSQATNAKDHRLHIVKDGIAYGWQIYRSPQETLADVTIISVRISRRCGQGRGSADSPKGNSVDGWGLTDDAGTLLDHLLLATSRISEPRPPWEEWPSSYHHTLLVGVFKPRGRKGRKCGGFVSYYSSPCAAESVWGAA